MILLTMENKSFWLIYVNLISISPCKNGFLTSGYSSSKSNVATVASNTRIELCFTIVENTSLKSTPLLDYSFWQPNVLRILVLQLLETLKQRPINQLLLVSLRLIFAVAKSYSQIKSSRLMMVATTPFRHPICNALLCKYPLMTL